MPPAHGQDRASGLPAATRARLAAQGATQGAIQINDLFVPAGRHKVRIDWRHRAAIPFLLLVLVASPLLLTWAAVHWILLRIPQPGASARSPRSHRP